MPIQWLPALERVEDLRGLREQRRRARHFGALLLARVGDLGDPVEHAGASRAVVTLIAVIVAVARPDCNVVGQIFSAAFIAAGLGLILFTVKLTTSYANGGLELLAAGFFVVLSICAVLLWNSYVIATSDVLCRFRHSRPLPEADPWFQPFVSLHIAAYNEPPDMLIETIRRAEAIDYPNFEVVVIDNNTKDPAVWRPIEAYCSGRPRVTFVHVDPWPGFKAGALNLALRHYTSPRGEIIGLIDADDFVVPHYLKETAPYFSDDRIGYLQSFEGNRGYEGSPYYTACVDSYQAFYLTNMSSRNERDSVPFVGTMGLFRRSALEQAGGWNEWCISEDTEASVLVPQTGLVWAVHSTLLRPGRRPALICRSGHAALPVVLRRHADPSLALAQPDAVGPLPRQPLVEPPAARLSHGEPRMDARPLDGAVHDRAVRHDSAVVGGFAILDRADRRRHQLVWHMPDRDRIPEHALGVAAMDEQVAPPCLFQPDHQPGVQLDDRDRLHTGAGAARGRLPPHTQERPEPAGGAAGVGCALVDTLGDGPRGLPPRVRRTARCLVATAHPADHRDLPAGRRVLVCPCRGLLERAGPDDAGRRTGTPLRSGSRTRVARSAAIVRRYGRRVIAMVAFLGAVVTASVAAPGGLLAGGTALRVKTAAQVDALPAGAPTVAPPFVGVTGTPGGGWLAVTDEGVVWAGGGANYFGDLQRRPDGPPIARSNIVQVRPTRDGFGYWLVGSDGSVYAFGDAPFFGSLPALGLHVSDVVGLIPFASGDGYELVSGFEGVWKFGHGTP